MRSSEHPVYLTKSSTLWTHVIPQKINKIKSTGWYYPNLILFSTPSSWLQRVTKVYLWTVCVLIFKIGELQVRVRQKSGNVSSFRDFYFIGWWNKNRPSRKQEILHTIIKLLQAIGVCSEVVPIKDIIKN